MDGEPPQEEDFSQIPIVERSQHKVRSNPSAWVTTDICRTGKHDCRRIQMSSPNQPKPLPILILSSDHSSRMERYCKLCLSVPTQADPV
jgi:hypothetical protein